MPSGSSATLSSSTIHNPQFVADLAGVYVGSVVVHDGLEFSSADTVNVTATTGATDISDGEFTISNADCSNYVGDYYANDALDIINWELDGEPVDASSFEYDATLEITYDGAADECTFATNIVPNHDLNDIYNIKGYGFNNTIAEQSGSTYTIDASPTDGASITELTNGVFDGIMLNGVVVAVLTGECWEDSGGTRFCSDWRENPFSSNNQFTLDTANAHTQPGGIYHYHGGPTYIFGGFVSSPASVSGVIGYASDGYPIYGPYILDADGTTIRAAVSGYQLIGDDDNDGVSTSTRPGDGVDTGPDGLYDGTYRQDYEWDAAHGGDLDECNGMTVDSQYGYYVTEDYPNLMACLKGTKDPSFSSRPSSGADHHANGFSHSHVDH